MDNTQGISYCYILDIDLSVLLDICYRFARVSDYKFVRCLRDLIVIPNNSMCPDVMCATFVLSCYFLLQIILSQNCFDKNKILDTSNETESTNLTRRTEKILYFIFFKYPSNHIREFISTSKFYSCPCLWFERHDFFSIDLFCVLFIYSDPPWKDFSSFIFFFSWFANNGNNDEGVLNIIIENR